MAEVRALSAAAFDDWPASASLGASGITELAAPETQRRRCAGQLLRGRFRPGDGHLHCQHDEQAHALRFAACFQYGDEAGALASALFSALCCADWRTARQPSLVRLFDAGADLIRIEIGKQSSRVLPAPAHAPAAPHGSTTGSARTTWATRAGSWPRCSLPGPRPEEAAGAGRAASQPGCAPPLRQPLLDRRRACVSMARRPAGARRRHSDFPAGHARQRHGLGVLHGWTTGLVPPPHGGVVPVQALESGTAMQGWRPFGSDGEPLLRCGDTVWTVACMDYPDGGNAPDEANYPLGGNTGQCRARPGGHCLAGRHPHMGKGLRLRIPAPHPGARAIVRPRARQPVRGWRIRLRSGGPGACSAWRARVPA